MSNTDIIVANRKAEDAFTDAKMELIARIIETKMTKDSLLSLKSKLSEVCITIDALAKTYE